MALLSWTKTRRGHMPSQAEPQTPWQQATGVYERWRRDPEVRAMWWKVATLLALVGLIVLGIGDVRNAARPTVEVYYVYVNQDAEVIGVEPMSAKPYNPDAALLEKVARDWLRQWRSVPLDVNVMDANWREALRISTPPVVRQLMAYAKFADIPEVAKKAQDRGLSVAVGFRNVRTISERIVKIEWEEAVYVMGNPEPQRTRYTGEIELIVRKPTNPKELKNNPLGIWIGRFAWSADQV